MGLGILPTPKKHSIVFLGNFYPGIAVSSLRDCLHDIGIKKKIWYRVYMKVFLNELVLEQSPTR